MANSLCNSELQHKIQIDLFSKWLFLPIIFYDFYFLFSKHTIIKLKIGSWCKNEFSDSINTFMLLFVFSGIYFLIERITSYASISHNVVYILWHGCYHLILLFGMTKVVNYKLYRDGQYLMHYWGVQGLQDYGIFMLLLLDLSNSRTPIQWYGY